MSKKREIIVGFTGTPAPDGTLLPHGSVPDAKRVPVTLDFNPQQLLGHVDIVAGKDGSLIASMDAEMAEKFKTLYPALSFVADSKPGPDGIRIITGVKNVGLGLCTSPNVDPNVPPIGDPRESQ